jgi:hypothetical protein
MLTYDKKVIIILKEKCKEKKANFVLWKKGSCNGIHKYDKKVIILLKEKMYFGNRQLE